MSIECLVVLGNMGLFYLFHFHYAIYILIYRKCLSFKCRKDLFFFLGGGGGVNGLRGITPT